MLIQVGLAGLGAVIGSMGRFSLLEIAPKVFGTASDWMVMVINLTAAFLIGILFGMHLPVLQNTFWATGIMGGYSTFSTPIVELANGLPNQSERTRVLLKTVLAFAGGVPVLLVGFWLGSLF